MDRFLASCDSISQSDVPDLEVMIDEAEEITNEDFLAAIGHKEYDILERVLGYGVALRLADDYHVSFNRSTFKGQSVVYLVHSCIEYIFSAE